MHIVGKIFLVSIFSGFSAGTAFGQGSTYIVDRFGGSGSHFTQIQSALDAAQSGDLVLVRDGIYQGVGNKNLSFAGKDLELRSENGPANCIIDPAFDGKALLFQNGETAKARVAGITVRNAGIAPVLWTDGWITFKITDGYGAGIVCQGSSPTFENCVIRDCVAEGYEEDPAMGAGVLLSGSNSVFLNCAIVGNRALCGGGTAFGGGIYASGGNPQFLGCLIADNSAQNFGGALSAVFANLVLRHCTIVNNSASFSPGSGGAIHGAFGSVQLRNSIIRQNISYSIGGPFLSQVELDYANLNIDYSDFEGGQAAITGQTQGAVWGAGNFDLDPHFAAVSSGNYRLLANSPCIDAGSNAESPAGLLVDLDGNPRGVDDPQVCDTGVGEVPVVDMGAYEFQPAPGAWTNLGHALAGSIGKPCLVGTGDLTPSSVAALQLSGAASNASAFLVMGITSLDLPFQGGILVPHPDRVIKLASGASGELSLNGAWPVNFPSGTTLYFQFWIADPAGPIGFAASNALEATTP